MKNDLDGLSRVHEMAACFVKHRAREFFKQLLCSSGLDQELYGAYLHNLKGKRVLGLPDHTEKVLDDHLVTFGQIIGTAYALGYADKLQGRTFDEMDSDSKHSDSKQLVLPGVLD